MYDISKDKQEAKSVNAHHTQDMLRLLRDKLEAGDINPGLWFAYFPNCQGGKVPTCQDCEAFAVCPFGHDREPVDCFLRPERRYQACV